jgi:dTDP-4-amino-4,6-dideoxygalactose transaminase
MFRSQGERTRYVTEELGWNYRMAEPMAALALAQLPKLAARNGQRRANAGRLSGLLAGIDGLVLPRELPGRTHVWHQYTVRVTSGREMRDALQSALSKQEIESMVFYPAAINRQPLYQRIGYGEVEMPVAERLAKEVLSLPVHPRLSEGDLEEIGSAVHAAMTGR